MDIAPGHSFRVPNLQLSTEATNLIMLWISPGTFTMGGRENEPGFRPEDEQPFLVTLTKGFWLGQFPVTQAQWKAVLQGNPSHFQLDGLNCPVENISWDDALVFCDRLNRHLINALPAGYRFSLPTEPQWEYACRAGTQTMYYSGESETDLARVAWYAGNSGEQTHPVGEKEPNQWELYDLHGNVYEWCYDAPEDYPDRSVTDWEGNGEENMRVIRSGAWGTPFENGQLRSAHRGWGSRDTKRPWIGFRVCLRWMQS
jgi:formylglycine-generating enzyme required for sulfatase activity